MSRAEQSTRLSGAACELPAHSMLWTPTEKACFEKELEMMRHKIKIKVEQKEKELQELKICSSSADTALKFNKDTFTKMIKLMKREEKCMKHHARSLQHGAQSGYRVHLDLILDDIADLKKEIAHRESLIKSQDAYSFFRQINALLDLFELPEERCTEHHWVPVRKFILDKSQVPTSVPVLCMFSKGGRPHAENRNSRMKSAHVRVMTWDPNTAHRNVSLEPSCEGNECATFKSQPMDYLDHPDRFSDCVQVLSREPLSGCCYFEVCPSGGCFIGLTYKSIERKGKGKQSVVGLNDKSWACFGGGYTTQTTGNDTWFLIPNESTNRLAIYLDSERGVLIFYSVVKGTLTVLSHIDTKFTEPLYLGAVFMDPGDRVIIPDVEDLV